MFMLTEITMIRLAQNFAYTMAADLWYHVQKFTPDYIIRIKIKEQRFLGKISIMSL